MTSPTPKRRASGPTIPEDRRAARQCLLRLRPETIADLDALASRWGLTRSATVARMIALALRGD